MAPSGIGSFEESDYRNHEIPSRLFSASNPPSLDDFDRLISETKAIHYPLSTRITSSVPIYELPEFSSLTPGQRSALQDEWYHILLSGPGVFVTKYLFKDISLIEKVSTVFASIIAKEKEISGQRGDHFAGSGANDRIWNSFSKHCMQDSESFLKYYSNPWLPLICAAWLGPQYRLTAQVNVVKPGAKAQISHRDYHIGFQGNGACARFPKAIHIASQFLTLQGAVAHSDMPVESGPTRLLPFSQKFEEGYMAYRIPEHQDYFLKKYVSIPLEKGDGLFFNPALFHAAGQNDSKDVMRSANLLQISSAFGKPMETIDTIPLIEATWNSLADLHHREGLSEEVRAFVGHVAEGYPFPTNLDRRVPETAGMAPSSEQDLLIKSLENGWTKDQVLDGLQKLQGDSRA
ncbi:similar to phytanoyl-CoA dioxygenase [Plenodomus lingam JN3]|uniref:Similar to phytanoyl-CoA dioxygenase n=1 Tax=Leptosphaeria maculans (strain JN3 / isolate v23.1.3 / race Av1-4-5-6-7-8) TaxID=985895 RepID=E5AEK0_LEPMJ|nr:similar to phytanoyl-CoA dioxygenase [Plenodomus lingam JN3]CBY01639.1 similar to phytanoyl-CoA dioxygenase [Plenodomus lingam JN3]